MAITRHYFPGNNTPEGFFSYYEYILGQREAKKIICIKGGPGTGKSTFLKRVGSKLAENGENMDFLHCSADEHSLDGIVLTDKKIAFIDGTSPHMIDPITPGAVDSIINFGEFWNERRIAENKEDILSGNEECSRWYRLAYNYLAAAKCVCGNLSAVHEEGIEISEIYKLAADIIAREYKKYDIQEQYPARPFGRASEGLRREYVFLTYFHRIEWRGKHGIPVRGRGSDVEEL